MDVAAALRSARHAADLTQRHLARRAGISAGALSRYESGSALPSLPALDRLLAACGKDLRLVVVDRVDDVDVDLGSRSARPRSRRVPSTDFLRGAFLERLVRHQTDVVEAGAWAADLHGLPVEGGEGRLLLADDPDVLQRTAAAFMAGYVPWREVEGHFGSLPVRPQTFVDHPVARWTCQDVGRFRTEVLAVGGPWPLEQRLITPAGPLRVAAAQTLSTSDGVQPEAAEAWRRWREAAGPDDAAW